jgi:hypothetical protein
VEDKGLGGKASLFARSDCTGQSLSSADFPSSSCQDLSAGCGTEPLSGARFCAISASASVTPVLTPGAIAGIVIIAVVVIGLCIFCACVSAPSPFPSAAKRLHVTCTCPPPPPLSPPTRSATAARNRPRP